MLEKNEEERIESPAHELLDRVEEGIDKALAELRVLSRNSKLGAVIGILEQLSQDVIGLEFDTMDAQLYHDFHQRISSLALALNGIHHDGFPYAIDYIIGARNALEQAGRIKVEQGDIRSLIVTNLADPRS